MDALILSLMAWLHFPTGHDMEVELPTLAITEVGNLCVNYGVQAANCEVMQLKNFYHQRSTIYLHGRFQHANLTEQSRLLDELVHYIQWHNAENVDSSWDS